MAIEMFTIYHLNDLHSTFHTWPQLASYVKGEREKGHPQLLLDIGDHADRSHVITEGSNGRGNVALLNDLLFDYVTIGNNEGITFAKETLDSMYEEARFDVLVANLFTQEGERPHWAKPYAVHLLPNGVRVGLIGLTAPFTRFYHELGWEVVQPDDVLPSLLKQLKEEAADCVVLLSHLGLFRDEKLADTYEELDVICGAHTHDVLPEGVNRSGTLITQAGKGGGLIGKIELAFDTEKRQLETMSAHVIDLTNQPKDDEAMRQLAQLQAVAMNQLNTVVVDLEEELPVEWYKPSRGAQWLCEGIAEWCGTELAMMNAGVLLSSLPKGKVTLKDLHTTCPHPINPCVVELSGAHLLESIERSLTNELIQLELKGFGFRGEVLGMMLFKGIDVQKQEDGSLTVSIQGEPLNKAKNYRVATLDMYTFGFLFPSMAEAERKQFFMPELLRDVLKWKLEKMVRS